MKKVLIGVSPSFDNMGICIYVPSDNKPYMKVCKEEKILHSTGPLNRKIEWITSSLKRNKLKLSECIFVVYNPNIDVLGSWNRLKGTIESYAKDLKQKPFTSYESTSISDVYTKYSTYTYKSIDKALNAKAGVFLASMLRERNVPVITQDEIKEPEYIKEKSLELSIDSFSACEAAGLVLGKNINWALSVLDEQESFFKKKPASYPRFGNGAEFIVKRR